MNSKRPPSAMRGKRAHLGLSQEDVAAHLKCDRSLVSLIENGRHNPSSEDKAKLAELLRCRVTDIFPKRAA